MPERINVIRLSDAEKETLREVSATDEVRAVAKAVAAALRGGGAAAHKAAQGVEMDPARFRALRQDLTVRLDALSAAPAPDDVKAPVIEKTRKALDIVDEALTMLGETPSSNDTAPAPAAAAADV